MTLSRPRPLRPLPLPLLLKEILSGSRRTKLAWNVPSQTCMMHNDCLDIVADLQLFHIAATGAKPVVLCGSVAQELPSGRPVTRAKSAPGDLGDGISKSPRKSER